MLLFWRPSIAWMHADSEASHIHFSRLLYGHEAQGLIVLLGHCGPLLIECHMIVLGLVLHTCVLLCCCRCWHAVIGSIH